uniref:Uncharacterized protein n=1 Tax=Anopheles quadriannulatus TaxID=34691 RepID=A0A182WWZ7_ANOQN
KHSCVWARRVGDGACGTKGDRCQPCLANDTLIKLKLFDTRNNFHRFFKIGIKQQCRAATASAIAEAVLFLLVLLLLLL